VNTVTIAIKRENDALNVVLLKEQAQTNLRTLVEKEGYLRFLK